MWNIVFSIIMIAASIDMYSRPNNFIITYLGEFGPVNSLVDSLGLPLVATILLLLGLYFLFDAIKAYKKISDDKEI